MIYEQSIKGVFDAIADIHKRLHKLEKEESEEPKQHPLDEMIEKALEDGIIIHNKDFYSKTVNKGWIEKFARKLRYESIKWAWEQHSKYTSDTPLRIMMLREMGKEHWIVEDK